MNKILIVEDEAPIAKLVRTALEGAGYRCVRAREEQEAARAIMDGGLCLEEYLAQ